MSTMTVSIQSGSAEQWTLNKGRHCSFSLAFHQEFTKICHCPACRNSICPSKCAATLLFLVSTHFPTGESVQPRDFGKTQSEACLPGGCRRCLLFLFGAKLGGGNGFDLFEGFFLEPELVCKVALTYLPAHLAFTVWPGTL